MTSDLHREAREWLDDTSHHPDGRIRADLVRDLIAENERTYESFSNGSRIQGEWYDQAIRERDEAQAWAAWFAAERDFYLQDYDENATWMHRRIRAAEAALDRVRKLADYWEQNGMPAFEVPSLLAATQLRRALDKEA